MKLQLENLNVITNEGGQLRSAVGPKAVNAFRLRTIISGLKFEAKTGMKMSRVSTVKVAKEVTGLKTNNKTKLIERLEKMLEQTLSEVAIVTDGEMQ